MRKYLLFITLALLAFLPTHAETVSESTAAWQAVRFLHLENISQLQQLKSPHETLYLFAVEERGFVIVSADNRVQPILGYSLHSNINADNLPSNLAAWLDGLDMQIRAAMEDAALPVHSGWQTQGTPKSGVDGYDSIVGPLLTTTWDQYPFYNNLCPRIGGVPTVTGCVATAMAQVMKYWNWPASGVGQHSYSGALYGELSANFGSTLYDWSNMPNQLTSSSTPTQVSAVATLMYHCGVAVEMIYGTVEDNGSAAWEQMFQYGLNFPCAENALRTYFKYSPSLTGVVRNNYTAAEWAALIKNEIDHRRPVLYSGKNDLNLGHEFICDGYDTNGFFHFNWGYSGAGDGFFALSLLNPLYDDFSIGQSAVIHIEPDTLFSTSTTCTVNATSDNPAHGSVIGSGVYNYRDTVTLQAHPASGYRFLHWSNGSTYNPFPLLAHDLNMTAYFTNALADTGEVLSYCGSDPSHRGVFSVNNSSRIGIKLPAFVLSGHKYLTAVELYHYSGIFVVNVHRGGDDAPGPIIYSQPCLLQAGDTRWNRFKFETPVPIDTNNNLWVTVRFINTISYMGVSNMMTPDGNWISDDNGATWRHLNEEEPHSSRDDTTICWFIRCVTSSDSIVDSQLAPTAFIAAPEMSSVGDTVPVEIMHSTASTVEWIAGDADYSYTASDTAYFIWNNAGEYVVEARVESPGGSTVVSETIYISDCETPIHTFPYYNHFNIDDQLLTACWQYLNYGEGSSYVTTYSCFTVLVDDGADERYISPYFDLGDETIMLELDHYTPSSCNITVEVTQGGLDSSDFTTIYTLPYIDDTEEEYVTTSPICLSDYYQGNPIRLAIRIRRNDSPSFPRFELYGLRLYRYVGIDEVENTPMAVYPNPARQTVLLSLPAPNGTLTLFDAAGHILMQRRSTTCNTSLDVSSLPQGVYMIHYTSQQDTATKRLVVK